MTSTVATSSSRSAQPLIASSHGNGESAKTLAPITSVALSMSIQFQTSSQYSSGEALWYSISS